MHAERCGCWKRPFFQRRLTAPRLGFRLGGASEDLALDDRALEIIAKPTPAVSLGNHTTLTLTLASSHQLRPAAQLKPHKPLGRISDRFYNSAGN
jgi:hypothetical protein